MRRTYGRMKTPVGFVLLLLFLYGCASGTEQVRTTSTEETEDSPAATAVVEATTPPPTATTAASSTPEPGEPTAAATATVPAATATPTDTIVNLSQIGDLQALFNQDQGMLRLVVLLSPGCPSCIDGARWLQDSILAQGADLPLRVYAVWFPTVPGQMLPPDLSGRRAEGVLTDPRVVHLYDGQRLASQWFAENTNLEGPERSALGRTFGNLEWGEYVWDSYFLYGPEVGWEEGLPPALQSGYPIINRREEIRTALDVEVTPVTAETTGTTTYEIVPQESLVSYGVEETLAGRKFNYAIGVTNSITGQMTIDPERPSASEIGPVAVTVRDFSSDNFLRDERIQQEFLQSARFPIATFRPTELQGLPESYTMGETITFEIVGDLEVRETVVPTTFNVEAKLENGRLTGVATSQILMTDFGFDPPSIADLIQTENEVDITFEFVAQPATP